MSLEDLLEYAFKGLALLTAVILGFLMFAPSAIGLVMTRFALEIWNYPQNKREQRELEADQATEYQRYLEKMQIKREKEEKFWEELRERINEREEIGEPEIELEPPEEIKPKTLNGDWYIEKELSFNQRDALFATGYKRLKTSPDGKSGAAYYWVRKRFNESKEHAFFCYLIRDMLKKRGVKEIKMNITSGPDLEFEFKRKRICFEVETGSNMIRNSTYVFKKFAFNHQNFHKCFVFVTRKKFKYCYSKLAELVTRSTLKKTISELGKDKSI